MCIKILCYNKKIENRKKGLRDEERSFQGKGFSKQNQDVLYTYVSISQEEYKVHVPKYVLLKLKKSSGNPTKCIIRRNQEFLWLTQSILNYDQVLLSCLKTHFEMPQRGIS